MILDPSWLSYEPIIISAGGNPVHVALDYKNDYRITREALEAAVTEKTKLMIINYPNNPTGRILHEDEADILEAFIKDHQEIYVISDEIYESIVFDGKKSISLASRKSIVDRVITVNGFSKSVAMTGWRLGYMVSNKEVFNAAFSLYSHSLSCISGFVQVGAVEAFKCQREIEDMRKIYEERRDIFCGILNSIPRVSCTLPEGAFYAWVFYDINGRSSEEMSEYLLENVRVAGMPGTAYGEYSACCMRFSIANATNELEDAANRIKEALLKLQGR